jgi:1,4-alpha-glucan branching enzyme
LAVAVFISQKEGGRSTADGGSYQPRGAAGGATAVVILGTRVPLTDEIELLIARRQPDPHRVLGAHPAPRGAVVRVYRPDAQRVRVLPEGGEAVVLRRRRREGVFAGTIEGASLPLRYELELTAADGATRTLHDPYAYLPTVGELDLHLAGEGRHEELYRRLGAHPREIDGVAGVGFAVWAPSARSVSVVGDFNDWDGRVHQLRSLGGSGVWELFVPEVGEGAHYKFEIGAQDGGFVLKADPYAFRTEEPPRTASVVFSSHHHAADTDWLDRRRRAEPHREPVSVYEVHLGSWRRNPLEGGRSLTYLELAEELPPYVADLGFTHVELMPVMEHPFGGSWGYQVTGYFAPTARYGTPDDFRVLVEALHRHGIGVILDWVPAHFPHDDFALARFDGTALYEHADPRLGAHPDWGTLIFNYGRNEVRNFLLASALFWLEDHHADGLRVDAVASMLYLDYSRTAGEWLPNVFGGRENLEAVAFLRELNEVVHARVPGVLMAAEESTAWPGVSRPTDTGGLGFGFKWNMGWMHDTLEYLKRDPVHRRHHHDELTFSLVYAFSENFVLPLSHDEVVHGKGSLLAKMPGDRWQQLANLRALYAYMWAHPGKKLLFMGGELAQEREWDHDGSLDWHLLDTPLHEGVQALVRDLNRVYRGEPALWELDGEPEGFRWIEAHDADSNTLVFARLTRDGARTLVCAVNFSPVPRHGYRIGLPRGGRWRETVNTDDPRYGGSGAVNGAVDASGGPWHEQPFSAKLTLPPLGAVWLAPESP